MSSRLSITPSFSVIGARSYRNRGANVDIPAEFEIRHAIGSIRMRGRASKAKGKCLTNLS